MQKNIIIIGSVDIHPEREAKLTKFLQVFTEVSSNVYLISGSCPEEFRHRINWRKVNRRTTDYHPAMIRLMDSLIAQVLMAINMAINVFKYNEVVALGPFLIPVLFAKLIRKKIIRYHAGPSAKQMNYNFLKRLLIDDIPNILSTIIIVPSKGCISHFGLDRYKNKISIASFHIDEKTFAIYKSLSDRGTNIGYIGELSKPKGVDKLVKAFELMKNSQFRLLLGGQGSLYKSLEDTLNENIELVGWIAHDELPEYLNRLKLFVLPSSTEGLPTIMLEAMACGTPVLVTPVGGIPDVIKDGQTGFIMEDNSPECIARNIARALNHPKLEKIAQNARVLVEKEYTYQAVVERYRDILASLSWKP